jgi:hypothetical protein
MPSCAALSIRGTGRLTNTTSHAMPSSNMDSRTAKVIGSWSVFRRRRIRDYVHSRMLPLFREAPSPNIFLNELVCQDIAVTEFVTGGIIREAIQDIIRRYLMKLLFGPSVDRLFGLGGQVVESRGACGGNLFGLWTGGQGLWARVRGW